MHEILPDNNIFMYTFVDHSTTSAELTSMEEICTISRVRK